MNGWIIYNGALKFKKFHLLVESLVAESKKKGIQLEAIPNSELLPMFHSDGTQGLKSLRSLNEPDFIIFWDKDIYLAKHLEAMGYRLFNRRVAIENCDHKAYMHLQMAQDTIRVPKTIVGPFTFHQHELSDEYIDYIFEELGSEVILKEVFGSFGMQVYKFNNKEDLIHKMKELDGRDFILQEPIKSSFGRDIRVTIIGNQVIGGMKREFATDFRANITLGGRGELVELTEEQEKLALKAHRSLGLDFSGVDLLFDEDDRPIVCEVNSNVNYLSFEQVSGVNVSRLLLDYIVGEMP